MAQLEIKQLNKIGLHESVPNRSMDEKLLLIEMRGVCQK